MPPLIPIIAAAAASISSVAASVAATTIFGITVGSIANVVGNVAIALASSFVLGAISKALTGKPKQSGSALGTFRDRTQAVRQPITVRRVIYGKVRVSGPYTFLHSTNSNQYLNLLLTLSGHPIESIDSVYFDDELIPLDVNGDATGKYAGYVVVKKGLGTTIGDSNLLSALMANCPGVWTSNHRQSGCGKLYVRLKYSSTIFPNGVPNISAIVKGKKVYDPRTGLTAWSENAGLCVRDYLANATYGLGESGLNDTLGNASANVCDENISLAGGGTENRYACNGTIDTDQKPKDVIGSLLTAMHGKVAYQGGEWNIYAGSYRTPTVTLDEDDLDGSIKVTTRLSRSQTFNAVKGIYVSGQDFYQPTDFPPITNATYLSEDQGERIWKDIELPFTVTASCAQRIAKIELEKARQQITTVWPCKLTAFQVQAGDVVNLTNIRFGWSAKPFEVTEWKFAIRDDNGVPRLGIDLFMRETASTAYDWSSGEETTVDPSPNTTLPDPFTVAVPGTPSVSEELYETTGSAGVKSKAIVTWGESADAFVDTYQLEHKAVAASAYLVMTSIRDLSAELNDLAPGSYNFRVQAFNSIGVSSEYSGVTTKTILGLTAPPADVSGLSVIASNGYALASWTLSPDLDVQINGSIIIRHSPKTTAAAWEDGIILEEFPGGSVQGIVPLITGTYMAKAKDSTGNYSTTMTAFVATEGMVTGFTTVATSTQAPGFTGAKTNVSLVGSVLRLTDPETNLEGEYEFDNPVDMGTVATRRVEVDVQVLNYIATDLIDSMGEVDSWASVDGDSVDDCDATVYVATTNDDPAGSPVYGPWIPFMVADLTCRAMKFKIKLESGSTTNNLDVSLLTVHVKEAV